MSNKAAVPDAWDDEWETVADQPEARTTAREPEVKLTKAELRAKHAEANKQLWEAAEAPERPLFLEAKKDVSIVSDFKPTVKVLSRKPQPKLASRSDPASGMANISLEDDSEEEERRRNEASFAERQARAQREREEKQRRYAEVRERLFGSSTAETVSPQGTAQSSGSRNSSRGKGRGRSDRDGQPSSSADQSPARPGNQKKQLFDPSYTVKPNSVHIQRKEVTENQSGLSVPNQEQPIRAPRSPDGSGRGGFGFASRGDRLGANPHT